ncbi:MAG: indole-3-glycerol phosphate synthase TrpC [Gemmatimonadaceae bacterium]
MQARPTWSEPTGTLGAIVGEAHERAAALLDRRGDLERAVREAPQPPSLAAALRRPHVAVLAEVKRRSPSKGTINAGICAPVQAAAYLAGGAAGISVLTEPAHFGGSAEDLPAVRAAVPLPVLRKDFHVAEIQLLEARALGASAALLIARALAPGRLAVLTAEAHRLGLEVLVEVRDERELDDALHSSAAMIGVNNRNLESLVIDPGTSERLIPRIPPRFVAIAESGMASRDDVARAAQAGADAVLVGSAISAADDPAQALRALTQVLRRPRG